MNKQFFTTEISDPKFEINNLRFITVRTNNLAGRGDMVVYVPSKVNLTNVPVVILLHGVYGSAWCWAMKAGVHLIADKLIRENKIKPMVLVMPSDGLYLDGSAYVAHTNGCNYERWITEDVLAAIRQEIKITSEKSPLFITGLSMGGYGALRIGAKFSNLFKAFGGLSSITKFEELSKFYENGDISTLAKNVTEKPGVLETMQQYKATISPFMFDCGTTDLLIEENKILHNELLKLNIPHQFYEFEGEHNWRYWEEHIAAHLIFFNSLAS